MDLLQEESSEPYDFDQIFDDSGWLARRRSKKKLKLLRKIDSTLRELLSETERVRFVSMGSAVSFLESYLLGAIAYYLNRRAIILTNRRILLLQIDSRLRPKTLLAQIEYGAIGGVQRTAAGNAKIALRNGKGRVLSGVPRADRKALAQKVEEMRGEVGRTSGAQGVEDLCPRCFSAVERAALACGSCGMRFKSANRAGLLSLLFPGFGDFYLGHRKIAVLEVSVAALIWISVLLPDPEYPLTPLGVVLLGLLVVLFIHVPDALATRYIGRFGAYPAESPAAPIAASV
jgi:hypothetical protein